MKNLPYFWQSNLVAEKLLSSKLIFLRGVYKNNRLTGAQMFEQFLAVSSDEQNKEPKFVANLTLRQAPVLFSMAGGQRWHYKLEQSFEGLLMECEFGNRGHLKSVSQVRFDVLKNFIDNSSAYHNLRKTDKTYTFKSCHRLELQHLFNGKMKSFRPVYMLPANEHRFAQFEGLYPRSSKDEKLRLLGCYVYENGRFSNFMLAECLPKELANYFSR